MRGFGSASITNNSRAVAEFRGDGAALDRLLAEARELLHRTKYPSLTVNDSPTARTRPRARPAGCSGRRTGRRLRIP
jgi:hypothetical protein